MCDHETLLVFLQKDGTHRCECKACGKEVIIDMRGNAHERASDRSSEKKCDHIRLRTAYKDYYSKIEECLDCGAQF